MLNILSHALDNVGEDCQKNVLDKLKATLGFSKENFIGFLNQGGTFLDGTRSTASYANNITSPAAARAKGYENMSIKQVFQSKPGLHAETSITASTLTVYFRPDAINRNAPLDMLALLFHEALHGYGGKLGGTSYFDDELQNAFLGPSGVNSADTSNITNYIKSNCF